MELALLMPIVVVVLMALVELSRIHRWQVTLASAAHAGILYASKSKGYAGDTNAIKDRVLAEINELSKLQDGHSTPSINVSLGAATGDGFSKQQVDVSVSVTVPAMFSIAGFPQPWVLTETASSRVLDWEPGQ